MVDRNPHQNIASGLPAEATPRLDQAELRKRAEEQLKIEETKAPASFSPQETSVLLHELQVHQIELEMQNEELRRVQAELEVSQTCYFDLYDLAPVGYITVSDKGLLLEANLTVATLMGVTRAALVRQPLTRFILPEDQDIFYRHRKQLLETGTPQKCELRMLRQDGTQFWAWLEATVAQAADGAPVCRVVLSDVSKRKKAEEQLNSQLDELRRWQNVMLGREGRVEELKREVNELCRRLGEVARYPSQEEGSFEGRVASGEGMG